MPHYMDDRWSIQSASERGKTTSPPREVLKHDCDQMNQLYDVNHLLPSQCDWEM